LPRGPDAARGPPVGQPCVSVIPIINAETQCYRYC